MTAADVRAMIEAEIRTGAPALNLDYVDLEQRLVTPRKVSCGNTFPKVNRGQPLALWVVLEESPGNCQGYLVVFDECERTFGLAIRNGATPVFLGFHGTFLNALQGM